MPNRFALALLALASAFGQTPPAFEVASLNANKSGEARMSIDLQPGGRLVARNVPVKNLIVFAFHVRPDYIDKAPAWADSDRYDIVAKAPEKAPQDEIRRMMQTLLAERFQLAVHTESKPQSGYALVVGKNGAKLTASETAVNSAQRCAPGQAPPGQRRIECRHITMALLADYLQALAPRDISIPVVDQTGLAGVYDLALEWTPTTTPPPEDPGLSIFDAVANQLGLKLESRKLPLPVIVIDRIERVPAGN